MKKILITGGSKGIGFECVNTFLREGWHVICCSRNESRWIENLERVPELKLVEYHQCDVSDEQQVDALFNKIKNKHTFIDAAINNASPSVVSKGLLKDVDTSLLKETVNHDFWSTIFCIKQELDIMGHGGSIVNITSVNAIRPIPGAAMYGASKQAIESLTKSVALEAISSKIRVNSIAPGVTWTPRWEERVGGNPEIRKDVEDLVPMKRFARPREVADAAYWLISDKASYVVGHTLVVDGGLSLK